MGMENPLTGSYNRERTILTFHQRSLEVRAAQLAVAGGIGMVIIGLAKEFRLPVPTPLDSMWWLFFGLAFAAAGSWAFLLFRNLRFDIRKRGYVERFGSGMAVQWRRGSIDEVRCLELARYSGLFPTQIKSPASSWGMPGTPMPGAGMPAPGTLLVLRLWWHDPHRAPVVVEHLVVGAAYGVQDQRTQHFIGLAQGYAQALRVPLTGQL